MKNLVNLLSLAAVTTVIAIGQIMFKQVGITIRGLSIVDGLLLLLRQRELYAALAIYGVATLLWIWILSRVPLTQAYPWVAAGIVIVSLLGWLIFNETVGPLFWLGVALIIIGLMLTQYASLIR
jgi:drug/metabolite transporter (DMT)-like permease